MAPRAPDDAEQARRRKFLRDFHTFDSNIRFPAPYTQFAGKPLASAAGQGWRYDARLPERQPSRGAPRLRDPARLRGRRQHAGRRPGLRRHHPGPPGDRAEAPPRRGRRVYNFGATSACLNQMIALITTRLMDFSRTCSSCWAAHGHLPAVELRSACRLSVQSLRPGNPVRLLLQHDEGECGGRGSVLRQPAGADLRPARQPAGADELAVGHLGMGGGCVSSSWR